MLSSTAFPPVTLILSRRRRAAGIATPRGCKSRLLAIGLGIAAAALLAGCASTLPAAIRSNANAPVAAQWYAPLPHGGQLAELNQLAELSQWWAQFDDPLMLRLVEAGQLVSPTVAQAAARIADARAARIGSSAALLPALGASVDSSRGRSELGAPIGSVALAGLQASWELDLFGAGRAATDAAQARLESSQAHGHNARISIAAEVATTYVELRACEAQAQQAELDANSRTRTARITGLAATAGFQAPAAAELANASAAQANVTLIQQRSQCELLIKALNALTAQDEAMLRRDLATGTGLLPRPAELGVATLPAAILAQRPDIYSAAHDVLAASADADQAQAQRWPRITLAGNIGTTRIDSGGVSTDGSVWSIGPVTVTLPLFDGGARRANATAARARFDAAVIVYAARLREAIREVESALVALNSAAQRSDDTLLAATGFERSYAATEASYQAGTASLFELEDARRSRVAAQRAVIELQRERAASWIELYRMLGGGWSATAMHAVRNAAARR